MILDAANSPYQEERECDYKGEHYSARDNGAIMRHPKYRKRPLDNIWTFGEKDIDGYMMFRTERVHRIVATAFHGDAPTPQHVVDHIDTNRSNNRPENLRWLTKLENILLNEYTLAKVVHICGSVEAFLQNPQLLFGHESEDANFAWMRVVTPEEAKATRENLSCLASRPQDVSTKGAHVGDWIFKLHDEKWQPDFLQKDRPNVPPTRQESNKPLTVQDLQFTGGTPQEIYGGRDWNTNVFIPNVDTSVHTGSFQDNENHYLTLKSGMGDDVNYDISESLTPIALQGNWRTPTEFLCCPLKVSSSPLDEYFKNLKIGNIFCKSQWGESLILDFAISEDKQHLWVLAEQKGEIKPWGVTEIVMYNNYFLHLSRHTYFSETGGRKYFTLEQGKEWEGEEDCIDDYC